MAHDHHQSAASCGHSHAAQADHLTGANQTEVATCPVMAGNVVVKADAEAAGLFRDFEGERYWLCCASCGPLFDADPAKYARAA